MFLARYTFLPVSTLQGAVKASTWALRRPVSCQPQNLHWTPATSVDLIHSNVSMILSFTLPHKDCNDLIPTVLYGMEQEDVGRKATLSETLQFNFSNYFRRFQSSWIYHFRFVDLEGGSKVFWCEISVQRSHEQNVPTDPLLFKVKASTPPLPSSPVRLALLADWGNSDEAVKTMEGMLKRTKLNDLLSAILVAGDISYANSYLPAWESWLQKMEPLLQKTPLLVAPGNHEIECDRRTFALFQAYESYFRSPNRLGPAEIGPSSASRLLDCSHPPEFMVDYNYGNSFYGYQHGPVHVIVLNSYSNSTPGSIQYNWFLREVSSIDRTVAPWLLVAFHSPFHTTFCGHNDERNPRLMMQHLEPLFVQYGVNLVLSGHNHAYVRSHPLINNEVDPTQRGPVYLTVGTGGGSHSKGPCHSEPEPWVAHRDNSEYGFGELYVVNATHAYWERLLNRGANAKPEANDAVWFVNRAVVSNLPSTKTDPRRPAMRVE
eukprot:Nitzschia sp. Nitz4//scaffold58_size112336//55218//56745//NITZ4_004034-RA/size112336-snap-gene-0.173-mRNA-1//-1//CDS//3329554992//184//frame0